MYGGGGVFVVNISALHGIVGLVGLNSDVLFGPGIVGLDADALGGPELELDVLCGHSGPPCSAAS